MTTAPRRSPALSCPPPAAPLVVSQAPVAQPPAAYRTADLPAWAAEAVRQRVQRLLEGDLKAAYKERLEARARGDAQGVVLPRLSGAVAARTTGTAALDGNAPHQQPLRLVGTKKRKGPSIDGGGAEAEHHRTKRRRRRSAGAGATSAVAVELRRLRDENAAFRARLEQLAALVAGGAAAGVSLPAATACAAMDATAATSADVAAPHASGHGADPSSFGGAAAVRAGGSTAVQAAQPAEASAGARSRARAGAVEGPPGRRPSASPVSGRSSGRSGAVISDAAAAAVPPVHLSMSPRHISVPPATSSRVAALESAAAAGVTASGAMPANRTDVAPHAAPAMVSPVAPSRSPSRDVVPHEWTFPSIFRPEAGDAGEAAFGFMLPMPPPQPAVAPHLPAAAPPSSTSSVLTPAAPPVFPTSSLPGAPHTPKPPAAAEASAPSQQSMPAAPSQSSGPSVGQDKQQPAAAAAAATAVAAAATAAVPPAASPSTKGPPASVSSATTAAAPAAAAATAAQAVAAAQAVGAQAPQQLATSEGRSGPLAHHKQADDGSAHVPPGAVQASESAPVPPATEGRAGREAASNAAATVFGSSNAVSNPATAAPPTAMSAATSASGALAAAAVHAGLLAERKCGSSRWWDATAPPTPAGHAVHSTTAQRSDATRPAGGTKLKAPAPQEGSSAPPHASVVTPGRQISQAIPRVPPPDPAPSIATGGVPPHLTVPPAAPPVPPSGSALLPSASPSLSAPSPAFPGTSQPELALSAAVPPSPVVPPGTGSTALAVASSKAATAPAVTAVSSGCGAAAPSAETTSGAVQAANESVHVPPATSAGVPPVEPDGSTGIKFTLASSRNRRVVARQFVPVATVPMPAAVPLAVMPVAAVPPLSPSQLAAAEPQMQAPPSGVDAGKPPADAATAAAAAAAAARRPSSGRTGDKKSGPSSKAAGGRDRTTSASHKHGTAPPSSRSTSTKRKADGRDDKGRASGGKTESKPRTDAAGQQRPASRTGGTSGTASRTGGTSGTGGKPSSSSHKASKTLSGSARGSPAQQQAGTASRTGGTAGKTHGGTPATAKGQRSAVPVGGTGASGGTRRAANVSDQHGHHVTLAAQLQQHQHQEQQQQQQQQQQHQLDLESFQQQVQQVQQQQQQRSRRGWDVPPSDSAPGAHTAAVALHAAGDSTSHDQAGAPPMSMPSVPPHLLLPRPPPPFEGQAGQVGQLLPAVHDLMGPVPAGCEPLEFLTQRLAHMTQHLTQMSQHPSLQPPSTTPDAPTTQRAGQLQRSPAGWTWSLTAPAATAAAGAAPLPSPPPPLIGPALPQPPPGLPPPWAQVGQPQAGGRNPTSHQLSPQWAPVLPPGMSLPPGFEHVQLGYVQQQAGFDGGHPQQYSAQAHVGQANQQQLLQQQQHELFQQQQQPQFAEHQQYNQLLEQQQQQQFAPQQQQQMQQGPQLLDFQSFQQQVQQMQQQQQQQQQQQFAQPQHAPQFPQQLKQQQQYNHTPQPQPQQPLNVQQQLQLVIEQMQQQQQPQQQQQLSQLQAHFNPTAAAASALPPPLSHLLHGPASAGSAAPVPQPFGQLAPQLPPWHVASQQQLAAPSFQFATADAAGGMAPFGSLQPAVQLLGPSSTAPSTEFASQLPPWHRPQGPATSVTAGQASSSVPQAGQSAVQHALGTQTGTPHQHAPLSDLSHPQQQQQATHTAGRPGRWGPITEDVPPPAAASAPPQTVAPDQPPTLAPAVLPNPAWSDYADAQEEVGAAAPLMRAGFIKGGKQPSRLLPDSTGPASGGTGGGTAGGTLKWPLKEPPTKAQGGDDRGISGKDGGGSSSSSSEEEGQLAESSDDDTDGDVAAAATGASWRHETPGAVNLRDAGVHRRDMIGTPEPLAGRQMASHQRSPGPKHHRTADWQGPSHLPRSDSERDVRRHHSSPGTGRDALLSHLPPHIVTRGDRRDEASPQAVQSETPASGDIGPQQRPAKQPPTTAPPPLRHPQPLRPLLPPPAVIPSASQLLLPSVPASHSPLSRPLGSQTIGTPPGTAGAPSSSTADSASVPRTGVKDGGPKDGGTSVPPTASGAPGDEAVIAAPVFECKICSEVLPSLGALALHSLLPRHVVTLSRWHQVAHGTTLTGCRVPLPDRPGGYFGGRHPNNVSIGCQLCTVVEGNITNRFGHFMSPRHTRACLGATGALGNSHAPATLKALADTLNAFLACASKSRDMTKAVREAKRPNNRSGGGVGPGGAPASAAPHQGISPALAESLFKTSSALALYLAAARQVAPDSCYRVSLSSFGLDSAALAALAEEGDADEAGVITEAAIAEQQEEPLEEGEEEPP